MNKPQISSRELYTSSSLRYNMKKQLLPKGGFPLASEYLMKKYKDVKPDEPVQLSEKAKRRNWWEYHKIYFLIGALVLAAVGGFVLDRVRRVEPDYQIAFVSSKNLQEGVIEEISARLQPLLPDRNKDRKVIVQVNSYVTNEADPYAYVTQMAISNDVMMGNSSVFILEDPMAIQQQYLIFYQSDGTLPAEDATVFDCASYAWKDCPALADIDLGGEYDIALRGWLDDTQIQQNAGTEALWEALTAGAAH